MAKAEIDAMKALEDEENFSPAKQSEISSQGFQERSGLNLDATPFCAKGVRHTFKIRTASSTNS